MKKNHLIFMTILVGVNAMMSCTPKYTASFGPSQRFYEDDAKSNTTATATVSMVSPAEEADTHESMEIPPANGVIQEKEGIKALKPGQSPTASVRELQTSTGHVADEKIKEVLGKYGSKKPFLESGVLKDLAPKEKKALIKEVRRDIKDLKKAKKSWPLKIKRSMPGS